MKASLLQNHKEMNALLEALLMKTAQQNLSKTSSSIERKIFCTTSGESCYVKSKKKDTYTSIKYYL